MSVDKNDNVKPDNVEDQDGLNNEDIVTPDGKVYTEAEMTEIVSKRFSRLKDEAIKKAAEDLNKEALTSKADLENRLKAMEVENQVYKLAKDEATRDLLRATGLSGEALDNFAEKLKEQKTDSKDFSASKAFDLNNSFSQEDSDPWAQAANEWTNALKGGK